MTTLLKLIGVYLIVMCSSVYAQSNAEILKQIKGKSSELKEFRDLLNSPDASIRLSAFEAMYKSENQSLRQLALDEGINSQDAVLRALAFQELMSSLKTLSMTVNTDGMAPEVKKLVLAEIGDRYTINFLDFTRTGATLNFKTSDNISGYQNSNINGLRFNWETNERAGEATLKAGGLLSGFLRCSRKVKGISMPVSAILR